jgi:GH43 family beta-xylosidase
MNVKLFYLTSDALYIFIHKENFQIYNKKTKQLIKLSIIFFNYVNPYTFKDMPSSLHKTEIAFKGQGFFSVCFLT